MKKLKHILFLLLAVNVFALADTGISENVPIKNKNITNNKKIASNYEILRDILDKRNRELIDLGFQSDYIIKPEYNEWQIFFTGFYNHSNRNSKNSAVPYVLSEDTTVKSINLGKTITVREVNDISLNPEINIQSKVVAEAPNIVIPNISLPSLNVTAPTLNVNPNVISPNINVNTNISVPTVALSPITVVSFGLPYFASDNASLSHRFNVQPVVGYSQNLAVGGIQESIITLYGWGNPLTYIENNGGTLTVSKQNSRAMEVDEPINTSLHISNKGNIILNEQMTVGMEARGAQIINTADVTNHNSYISNDGTIIGNAGFRNQSGFSVGADGSVAGTLVHMRNSGNIIMNSPESIGIQLRPDVNSIVMQGTNEGTITINGYRSYGMMTTPGQSSGFYNQDPTIGNGTSALGLTATGIINVNGDESTGFAILVPINEWGGAGTINVGMVNPNQDPTNGNLHSSVNLVERATGLYSNQPNLVVPCTSITGSCGNAEIIGTGSINVGSFAYQSSGVRSEGNGIIGNTGQINITGNNNYGAVITDQAIFNNHVWTLSGFEGKVNVNSNNSIGAFINNNGRLWNESLINVNGNNSVGVLQNNGSTGNYGFDNNPVAYSRGNGTIETTGINSHAVIVTRENTGLISTFFNSGVIKNNTENTVGIYAEKGAQITHYLESGTDPLAMTSKIQSGNGAIGVYVKDTGTIANINAPIITGNSTASNTSIAVMSDGNAITVFNNISGTGNQASLNIGQNAVGLYSLTGSKFSNTFQINGLKADLGANSVLGYIKESTASVSNLANVTINSMGNNSAVLYGANNSDITIDSNINVPVATNAQLYVAENSKLTLNNGFIITGLSTGLSAFSLDNKVFSNGTPVTVDNNKTGVTNKGTVTMNSANSVGMYTLYGQNINETSGVVNIQGNSGVGMYSEEEAIITNKGNIHLNVNNAVGIYGKGDSGKGYSLLDNLNVLNSGTINLNNTGNIGIAVNNNKAGAMIADSVISNTGSINIIGNDSIGIYAPKSTVTNAGNMALSGSNTIGIYGADGSIITSTDTIDLGTTNQLQTAYYLTDTAKVSNLGDIKGYGIAVYGKDITMDDTFATIDLTGTSDQGAGKVGLVLSGTSNFNYSKDIKVGDSAGNNYSVALYTDGQNLSGGLANTLTAGANGVGLYAQNGSNIKYTGTINTGDGTTAGTGLYVGTSGLNTSTVDLEGVINLNGVGGIGAYVDNGSTFNFNSSGIMNFYGDGVALFGNAGAIINDNGGIINTNGYNVERTRIANGTINIVANTNIADNNILGHVVNGEMNVFSGVSVNATGDKIIGMYAEGLKGAGAWLHTYEANNLGTLDFTNAVNSTAMYLDNARGDNQGVIKAGNNSLGMYGVNNAELYNNSVIEIANKAVGMYGKSSKVENNNNISSTADEAIGMYGISANLENSGIIDLNNNSTVGMYGDNSNVANVNIINVTGENSIGMYGENLSNIVNNQDIFISNTSDISKANTGIYSNSSNAVNNNNITGGDNTIGVYNAGNFDNFGNITLGQGAVGVYSDGGTATIHNTSKIHAGEVALLVKNGVLTNNSVDLKSNFLGYAGINGKLVNNANLNVESTGFYSKAGEIENNGIITANNNEVIFFYSDNAKITNNADITGLGVGNIGIYGVDSVIDNLGNITVTDSEINSTTNSKLNKYAVGIYGKNSQITNTGNITVGENAIGIYANKGNVINAGNITANKNDSVGIFLDRASATNSGVITMNGDNSIGVYLQENSSLVNTGTININGKDSTGIYMYDQHSVIVNSGTINLNGDNSIGIITPENVGYTAGSIVTSGTGTGTSATGVSSIKYYDKPTIINAGQINVAGNFDTTGLDIIVKPDPANVIQTINKTGDSVTLLANSINVAGSLTGNGNIYIASDFSKGTNFETYILEDVINSGSFSGLDSGEIKLGSKSVSWEAVPVKNADGTTDIYMKKIAYSTLSEKQWFNDFSKALDSKYLGATGNLLGLYDKIDKIENENDFRGIFGSLAGNIYANMNQREKDIAGVFENSLYLLQDSKNNTKENVKINVIVGKGTTTGNTAGVIDYDYETAGVLALREIERTYKHKFGYSLGYTHTNFKFDDGNDSEELADTFQLGFHNKYRFNNDYFVKTDVTGRISLYNIDRNVDWKDGNKKSELNGHYETYSITVDNKVQREYEIDRSNSIIPYAGLKLGYLNRPTFTERGFESLTVKGSDLWEVQPNIGVEFKTSTKELNSAGLKLKGAFDVSYGYDLVDSNTEKAKLRVAEDNYHKLATPRNTDGTLKTRAVIGAEIEDRYGVFLTGEYSTGNSAKNDYKVGITLKAVF